MRTYTHGIVGYLLYLKSTKNQKKLAIIGAILPDIFIGIGFIFHYLGESKIVDILHNLFHHSFLQTITEFLHSFVLVIPFLVISYFLYKKAFPFFIGMISHVILDLLTHQKWAYNHLFPFVFEPIRSILDYTSLSFTIVEHIFVLAFIIWYYRNKKSKK